MNKKPIYKRVLLKLSGEVLMGSQNFGIDPQTCQQICLSIKQLQEYGVQIGIVIGGGNIFRGVQGATSLGMERVPADHIGMLATVINGITLQQTLLKLGCDAKVMSSLGCTEIAEPFLWKNALEYLNNGSVVIFTGGTGSPFFTTDTAAALRASEIRAEILLKATKVDGIYNKDPAKHPDARKYEHLSYSQVLADQLQVMDLTAIALCRENRIPIRVFHIFSLLEAVTQHNLGTLVEEK